ncbi:MAG TPA: response regulator [Gammaproteobacteria bacterium]|nr:response regulator [Gammaproteobacteria bacterium]
MAILHVDDEAVIREVVCRALEAHGFVVASVDGVRTAKLALAERRDLTGALLDIRLRDGNGLDLYQWIVVHQPRLAARVAFVTGSADAEAFGPLLALGCRFLRKPFEIAELIRLAEEWEGATDAGPP